jgi:hypothetical protein
MYLPGLVADDPQNRLSSEARLRISEAYMGSQAIRDRALAEAEVLNPKDLESHPLVRRSLLEAARVVLLAKTREFAAAGMSTNEIDAIMEEELEGASWSLDLTGIQSNVLRTELFQQIHSGKIETNSPPKPQSTKRKKRERPTEISDELKERALGVQGGKARAQILYETKYPKPQQVKNVSSILRHYRGKCAPDQG